MECHRNPKYVSGSWHGYLFSDCFEGQKIVSLALYFLVSHISNPTICIAKCFRLELELELELELSGERFAWHV